LDAESLIDLCAFGVVDACDDLGDPIELPSNASRKDVRIVAAGNRGERLRLLDAGLLEYVSVKGKPRHPVALKIVSKSVKCLRVLVDYNHRMTQPF
jgi:hypothetical protein